MPGISGLSAPKIAQVQFVRRFPREDIRRSAFALSDELKGYLDAPLSFHDIPNAPIDQPKFVIADGRKNYLGTDILTQLTLDFSSGTPSKGLLAALDKPAKVLDRLHSKALSHQHKYYCGIVLTFAAQITDPNTDLQSQIMPMFSPIKGSGAPAVLDVTLGWTNPGKSLWAISASEYMQYNRQVIQSLTPQQIQFDPDFETPSERGLQIKIDVSTKPQRNTASQDNSFESLLPVLFDQAVPDARKVIDNLLDSIL